LTSIRGVLCGVLVFAVSVSAQSREEEALAYEGSMPRSAC
jgi:hypothetical protein